MSDLGRWIEGRRPPPPMDLGVWITGGDQEVPGGLIASAVRALAKAQEDPGRNRESAFSLLAADALVTYACEVALELPEPETALLAVLDSVVLA